MTMAAAPSSQRAFTANAVLRKKGGSVLIIGAGFAGLVAGYELEQAG